MRIRQAKIKCPHCGGNIIVRDASHEATEHFWEDFEHYFEAMDRRIERMNKRMKPFWKRWFE